MRPSSVQIRLRPMWTATLVVLVLCTLMSGCGSTISKTRSESQSSAADCAAARSGAAQTPTAEPPTAPPASGQSAGRLADEVTEPGAFVHLRALQAIACEHGGHRSESSPGYDASVDYVVSVLRAAGYDVSTPTYQESGHDSPESGTARNVITQTRTGDDSSVVVVGAHLDSVKKGPGIVDDGSGVATLLEIASSLGPSAPIRNAVRFAFFGSEEEGALGSTAYVESLSPVDRDKISLYLNVDMVASPNAGYFVQGGKGDDRSESGPPGSATVARILAAELAKTGVTAETIEFVGDDESPFVEAGIPSGGAENGDAEEKSDEQAKAWGGEAGEVFDSCYHEACDGLGNVNRDVLDHYLHAIAGTVAHFATSSEKLSG